MSKQFELKRRNKPKFENLYAIVYEIITKEYVRAQRTLFVGVIERFLFYGKSRRFT